jgi:hypothetical protein
MKVPLFVHNGVQIYFRFKLDALYQHLQNPGVFLAATTSRPSGRSPRRRR